MSDKIKLKILCIALTLIGGLPCLFYWGSDLINWVFSLSAEQTAGYVTDNIEDVSNIGRYKKASDQIRTYTIYVQYEVDGRTYVRVTDAGTHFEARGTKTTVYYRSDDPQRSVTEIDMKKQPHAYYIGLFVLGVVLSILDLKGLISLGRKK